MAKVFIEKSKNLSSFLVKTENLQISVYELMYNHAIKISKDAAFDENFGSGTAAKAKYKKALRLFELLAERASDEYDSGVLRCFINEFRSRLEAVVEVR